MLFNRSHCLTLAIFVASIAPVVADGRTWTDRTGNAKVEAELVTVKQGKGRKDRAVFWASPGLLFCRALALGIGYAWGLARPLPRR